MFILLNQIDHNEIKKAMVRWCMARWHMQQRCGDDLVKFDTSVKSLYNAIMLEFERSFPISSKQPAQFEKMCNLAGRIAYGTP